MNTSVMFDAPTCAAIWALVRQGHNYERAGRQYGVGRDIIRRELRRAGYPLRTVEPLTDADREAMADAYRSGASIREVSKRFRRGDEVVSRILREMQVPLRGNHARPGISDEADADAPRVPPRWAIAAYRQHIARGVSQHVALAMSHLNGYAPEVVAAAVESYVEARVI